VPKIAVRYVGGNVMSVVMFDPDRNANVPIAPEAGGECHHWSSLLHMHHDSTPVSDWKENVCQFKSHHCKCCHQHCYIHTMHATVYHSIHSGILTLAASKQL